MPTADEINIQREKKLSINKVGGQMSPIVTARPSRYDKPGGK